MTKFAETLKSLRLKHQFTIKNLALLINVNPKTISSWEKGKTCPSSIMLIKIVKLFNVTCKQMLGI